MTIEFEPSSWLKAAEALLEEAEAFRSGANATLAGNSDVGALGAAAGSTLADAAIASVLPPVFEEVAATIAELSAGLSEEAGLMRQAARDYADTESENDSLARDSRGV